MENNSQKPAYKGCIIFSVGREFFLLPTLNIIQPNFKARIMLMERYKIQKGNIHSYQFAMDAAA